jgi:hypothetical protein
MILIFFKYRPLFLTFQAICHQYNLGTQPTKSLVMLTMSQNRRVILLAN